MLKQEKGITLVALVITIIVLLILAGVSISLVIGENGIMNKATDSKTETAYADLEEKFQLAVSGIIADFVTDEGEVSDTSMWSWLVDKGAADVKDEINMNLTGYTVTDVTFSPDTNPTKMNIKYKKDGSTTEVSDKVSLEKADTAGTVYDVKVSVSK